MIILCLLILTVIIIIGVIAVYLLLKLRKKSPSAPAPAPTSNNVKPAVAAKATEAEVDDEDITTETPPAANTPAIVPAPSVLPVPTISPTPAVSPEPVIVPPVAPVTEGVPGYSLVRSKTLLSVPTNYTVAPPANMAQFVRSANGIARADPYAGVSADFLVDRIFDIKNAVDCKAVCDSIASCVAFVHDKEKNKCIALSPRVYTDTSISLLEMKIVKGSYKSLPGGSIKSLISELPNPLKREPLNVASVKDCRDACDASDKCQAIVVQSTKCYIVDNTDSNIMDIYVKA